ELPVLNGSFEVNEMGTCGASELKNNPKKCNFIASFQGGNWKILTVDNGLQSSVYENKTWIKKQNFSKIQPSKNGYVVSLYRMNDGFLLKQSDITGFVSTNSNINSSLVVMSNSFNSSKIVAPNSKNSVFDAKTHVLFFDETQLGEQSSLNFELKMK
ncbi:MAG: hypothetical protein KJ941_03075, partial [Bacteroidetes bacterium]|nr:hypothetical protein [Bacteroidota bacterium]